MRGEPDNILHQLSLAFRQERERASRTHPGLRPCSPATQSGHRRRGGQRPSEASPIVATRTSKRYGSSASLGRRGVVRKRRQRHVTSPASAPACRTAFPPTRAWRNTWHSTKRGATCASTAPVLPAWRVDSARVARGALFSSQALGSFAAELVAEPAKGRAAGSRSAWHVGRKHPAKASAVARAAGLTVWQ